MNQMSWMSGCGSGLGGLEQCYNDVQAVEALLTKILTDMLAKNPNLFGQMGAIKGVTDGSGAQPGDVGEIVAMAGSATYPANTVNHVTLTTMGTLPAGDWSMQAWVGFSAPIIAFALDNVPSGNFNLSGDQENQLIPPGMSWIGVAMSVAPPGTVVEGAELPTITGYYRSAGPAQITLRTIISSATAGGTATLGFVARRMR